MKGYRVHTWRDECSMYDPQGVFDEAARCYMRTYRAFVPTHYTDEEADDYVANNFWRLTFASQFTNRPYCHEVPLPYLFTQGVAILCLLLGILVGKFLL